MAPPVKQSEVPKSEPTKTGEKTGETELEQLRAAKERADRRAAELETELEQLRAKARLAANAAFEDSLAEQSEGRSFRNAAGQLVDEKYRGVKQYRVGPAGAYRDGQLYIEGEIITLVDAVPSRTWTPHEPKKKAAAGPVEAPVGEVARDADAAI